MSAAPGAPLPEDGRVAAGITVTLSGQVIAASLAALAFEIAAWTYVADKRQVGAAFIVVSAASFGLFVASIFVGGKGMTEVRNDGFAGKWEMRTGKRKFNLQAIFCLIALLLFGASIAVTSSKEDEVAARMTKLEQRLTRLEVMARRTATESPSVQGAGRDATVGPRINLPLPAEK